VANQLDGTVSEVNPGSGTQVAVIPVGNGPSAITFGYRSVWVANVTDDTLSRINAATDAPLATIPLDRAPAGIAAGAGAVWVTSQQTGELLRVDPADDRLAQTIATGRTVQSPAGVAVGGGGVWVAGAGGAVARFDPRTGKARTIKVGGAPAGVAYSSGAVWVADSLSGTVARIDPATDATRLIRVGNQPTDVAAAAHRAWVTVLPSLASHRGGTLTVIGQEVRGFGPLPTDPAVAYVPLIWQMLSMTNDGLVGYRRVAGLAGNQLVPDLATALPAAADGGKTYTFRLRTGIRYSTGALVRPEDFRRAIQRVFMIDKKQGNPAVPPFYAGIVGARQCERSAGPCHLARGIVANDAADTVTFHLTAPDPEFLYKLAFSWAYAAPPSTPDHQINAAQLPATGPYMTKSLVPGHTWILARNPRFRQWSQQAQPGGYPDRIVLRSDIGPDRAVADVEHGRADVVLSPPPASISQLATHYTSQLHSGPFPTTIALTLNARIAPFDKLAARKAVNDAIDRNTVTAINGGSLNVQPTCQILPPTMPGYRPYCPYTIRPTPGGTWTAPNLALARRLVRASGTRGDRVTVLDSNVPPPLPSLATGRYVVSVLDQLGYRASLRILKPAAYFGALNDSRNRPQAGFYGWEADFPAPSDFIPPVLACGSFSPDSTSNRNDAEFCDPRIDTRARQALTLETTNRAAAAGRWSVIDRQLVGEAPWVPLYNPREVTVLSARAGNYQFHPYWALLIDQLWVR
jgi:YVTN family beta-propeller protein